jgi:DNA-binding NarL/FixJ family response regulator
LIKTLKILIVDDHRLVRDGIKTMLVTQADKYEFDISEAENSEIAFEKIRIEDFDIILMDYQLPDVTGPDAVIRILRQKPNAKILALSNYDEYTCISNMIDAGAKGYVLKNISPDELTIAIETILTGDTYYAKEISEKIDISKRERTKRKSQLAKYGVTERQIEILKLISIGMTNEEISTKLKLAKRTIDTHRQNLLVKLGVNNTAALIKKATDLSILE